MKLRPSSAAKALVIHGLLVSFLPLAMCIERVCEVWLNIPEIPLGIIVKLDIVFKVLIASTVMPLCWVLFHPLLYVFKREWNDAKDALLYSLGGIICLVTMSPAVFALMLLLEMRL